MEQNSTSSRFRDYKYQRKLSWWESNKWWIQTLGVVGTTWFLLWLIITS